ncbi:MULTISPECIES: glutamine-hydrolyzing carbamoyl-phosphate synthase small subunit [Collinsella]|uniref:Carbamoyl phosphate synthase small chain n=1 Tax=Collinsella ihumii TaxID=1720204 RepID=A0A921IQF2_9ACTN|nr:MULTISPECIES: glutamine-hydrolyzing carbamoyl-phosphate synthase small subunit [Collinsella]MDN0068981.1 glutamine-hydrolyzing carbamoyl-phosphate synthase small subunit [Collinsella ihumii]OUO61132.1 carbamoyl phosphate synthase small subunit [Collinsella sp. An271]HJG31529.1 glutamine-hydrolyzing carbamoyl-phosphate synthase small subunit [Collinsella ihumii]
MECNIAAGIETRKAAPSDLAQRIIAQTSKGYHGPAILMLEDGTVFYGRACGASGTATGEVCFNTSLEGYFEVLTDPSYAGQIVTMTYPQIGNYGIDPADVQSAYPGSPERGASTPALRGMVVHDMCPTPSNWRSAISLPEYLKRTGIVAIEGVDTRALVRHLRDNGAQKGIISTEVFALAELAQLLEQAPSLVGENLVRTVSCDEPHPYTAADLPANHAFASAPAPEQAHYRVVAYDCGIKRGILEGLVRVGCELTVVPWDTPAEDVLAKHPDGVFLSNGPGDPDAVEETYSQVEKLIGKVPLFGICLGHQMISLACGAEMEKLKFGHRGGNQPVMNLISHRVEITAQNHGFGLVFPSLGALVPELSGGVSEHPADGDLRFWVERGVAPVVENERFGRIRLTHVNLNDGTAEGIQLLDQPAFSVQYHPEAAPGPTDAHYLFTAFTRLMDGDADYLNIDIAKDRLAGWVFATE